MDALSRIAKQLARTKLDEFEMWRKRLPFVRRKRAQQMIAVQVGLKIQHDFVPSIALCALLFYSGPLRVS
jgi:hypothetical protein